MVTTRVLTTRDVLRDTVYNCSCPTYTKEYIIFFSRCSYLTSQVWYITYCYSYRIDCCRTARMPLSNSSALKHTRAPVQPKVILFREFHFYLRYGRTRYHALRANTNRRVQCYARTSSDLYKVFTLLLFHDSLSIPLHGCFYPIHSRDATNTRPGTQIRTQTTFLL